MQKKKRLKIAANSKCLEEKKQPCVDRGHNNPARSEGHTWATELTLEMSVL